MGLVTLSMPLTSSATETSNKEVLPQECDPQAEKNQKDIEDFLNSFMTNTSCKETNGIVICAVDNRPVVNLAAPESLGEEISLNPDQESDLQSRLARLSEIFDLSVEEPLAITKDNKVYQIDSSNNIVTEIDLTTQQRKDVALDPSLLVAGFGGSGRLEILNEKGQSDFIDFNELFNSGSKPAASNTSNNGQDPLSSYNAHLNDFGVIDPRSSSNSSMGEIETPSNEEENENLLSQFAAIQQKLDLILETLKKKNPEASLNFMMLGNKNTNPRETRRRPSLKPGRFIRSGSFDFHNIAESDLRNVIDPASSFSSPNLTSPNDSNSTLVLGDSSIASSHSDSNESLYAETSSPSDIISSSMDPTNSEFDSQIENLESEIFGKDILEDSRIFPDSIKFESNSKSSKKITPSLSSISKLTSLNRVFFERPELNRIHQIMGFFELKNPSISNSVQKTESSFKFMKSEHSSSRPRTPENKPQQAESTLLATLNDRRKLLAEPPAKNLA